jgi:hypothetical protein
LDSDSDQCIRIDLTLAASATAGQPHAQLALLMGVDLRDDRRDELRQMALCATRDERLPAHRPNPTEQPRTGGMQEKWLGHCPKITPDLPVDLPHTIAHAGR